MSMSDIDHGVNLLVRLNSMMQVFSAAEAKVATEVMLEPNEVVYCSVTELAERAQVSEATVLRFARRLGYRSYQDLKMDLAKDVFSRTETIGEQVDEDDLITGVTQSYLSMISNTAELIDRDKLESAIRMLAEAEEIHFFGVGHSGITAKSAACRLFRLGFRANAFEDTHFQLMDASKLSPKDVAVGISVSGSTKDTVDAMAEAKARGAKTLAITAYVQAPIAKFSDLVLLTSTREAPIESGSFVSKVAQLYVLDLLSTGLVRLRPDCVLRNQERMGRAISPRLY